MLEALLHYDILERIGSGHMGEVYRARDTRLGREVALKVLPQQFATDPERRFRFEREAQAIAALNHPNIVTVHSIEETEGLHFITMELVEGTTLSGRIPEGGMTLDAFFGLARPLVEAISAAHQRGIVHRDLKPDNVRVTPQGVVKILDFGVAKFVHELRDPGQTPVSAPDTDSRIVGTIPYMAPEQLSGGTVDATTDIFSVGVLFYEMLAGSRPFRGETLADLVHAVSRVSQVSLVALRPGLPARLGAMVDRCLAKDSRERFPSCRELLEEIDAVLVAWSEGGATQPSARASEPRRRLAVFPFANLSVDPDLQGLGEGAALELLERFAALRALQVPAPFSTLRLRSKVFEDPAAPRMLGAQYLLRGAVRKTGGRIRVAAELTRARDGFRLWGESYDRSANDFPTVLEEIAKKVERALHLPGEEPPPLRCPTRAEAYPACLRGRLALARGTRRALETAAEALEEARVLDPSSAPVLAALAEAHAALYRSFDASDKHRESAERAAQEAVAAAPRFSRALAARGSAHLLSDRIEDARSDLEAACLLDARAARPRIDLAGLLEIQEHGDRALDSLSEAAVVHPDDPEPIAAEAFLLRRLGREEDAIQSARRAVALFGRYLDLDPEDAAAFARAASVALLVDQPDLAERWMARALATGPEDPRVFYEMACAYAISGRSGEAAGALEESWRLGPEARLRLPRDARLETLRGHPKFEEIALAISTR